jgi:hypothetical protein
MPRAPASGERRGVPFETVVPVRRGGQGISFLVFGVWCGVFGEQVIGLLRYWLNGYLVFGRSF